MAVQKADILVNLIASGDPDMSTASAVSRAFREAAGPQLQSVTHLHYRLLVKCLVHAGYGSCFCLLILV